MSTDFIFSILPAVTGQFNGIFDIRIAYAVTSILIFVGVFTFARAFFRTKLTGLRGSHKLFALISLIIILIEGFYLASLFDLLEIANEVLASIGIASGLIIIALQNLLKNAIAGIDVYLNAEIDVGDVIEIDGIKGVISEIHLTKTVIVTSEGVKFFIPNLKFNEAIVGIS
jgi:small conductance mechanosensitive channel